MVDQTTSFRMVVPALISDGPGGVRSLFKGLRVEIQPLVTKWSYGPTIHVIIVALLVWICQKVRVRFLGLISTNHYSTRFCAQKCKKSFEIDCINVTRFLITDLETLVPILKPCIGKFWNLSLLVVKK